MQAIILQITYFILFAGQSFEQSINVTMNIFTIIDDASGTSGLRQYSRTRHLKCFNGPLCDEIMLLHIGYLPYSKIRVEVSFPDIDSLDLNVSDVTFEVSNFTKF